MLRLLLLLLVLGAAAGPRPRLRSVTGGGVGGPDSMVTLKTKAYVRNFAAGDTIRYVYRRNDSLQLTHRSVHSLDSALVGAPPYGGSATYKGCAQIERGGRTSGLVYPASPLCWIWSYARAAPPVDPVLDSVRQVILRSIPDPIGVFALRSDSAAPTDSNRARVCPFAVLKSGRRVKMQNAWNKPACETLYRAWLAETPT